MSAGAIQPDQVRDVRTREVLQKTCLSPTRHDSKEVRMTAQYPKKATLTAASDEQDVRKRVVEMIRELETGGRGGASLRPFPDFRGVSV